jgi:AraC-like DNA-binding protein
VPVHGNGCSRGTCRLSALSSLPARTGAVIAGVSLEEALYAAIRTSARQGDSVDELAARAGFSARQLRRLMVRAFGVAPVQIMQTERLLFAKKLLQETTLPTSQVALSAGFGSVRRFNTLFRSRYSISPTALRKQSGANQFLARRHTQAPSHLSTATRVARVDRVPITPSHAGRGVR